MSGERSKVWKFLKEYVLFFVLFYAALYGLIRLAGWLFGGGSQEG